MINKYSRLIAVCLVTLATSLFTLVAMEGMSPKQIITVSISLLFVYIAGIVITFSDRRKSQNKHSTQEIQDTF
ncbi:hypothetical protein [Sporosarcina sp. FSL W7-1283]|uniref:hypothetical protein n=1 Tax=Sporosarcina sp. FSL W7-1283 TaxID=2921560 RepID=UPI0030F9A809